MNCISSLTLDTYLDDIKEIFRNFDFERLKKMIFLSTDSFLEFIDNGAGGGQSGKSLKEIIEAIEPFIPLVINDEALNEYLITALSRDGAELDRIQNQFIQTAKITFVKTIINARSDEDLEEIFGVCRTIRDYKEGGI